MREQITAAITAAENQGLIDVMSGTGIEPVVDLILEHLSRVPDGTPAPQVIQATAGPTLALSAADVIAMVAAGAADQAAADLGTHPATCLLDEDTDPEDCTTHLHESARRITDSRSFWDATELGEVRELLFRVQPMFGVRCRAHREHDHSGHRELIVAGEPASVTAFTALTNRIIEAGRPTAAALASRNERRTFWATVGTILTDSDRAADQIDAASDAYLDATNYLVNRYGLARNLHRTSAASEGEALYTAAAQAAAAAPTQG